MAVKTFCHDFFLCFSFMNILYDLSCGYVVLKFINRKFRFNFFLLHTQNALLC